MDMKMKCELLDQERTTKARQNGLKGAGRYFGHVGVKMGANFEAHHSHIRDRGGTSALANHAAGYHGGLVEDPKIRSKVIKNKLVLGVEALNGFVIDGTANTMITMSYSIADRKDNLLDTQKAHGNVGREGSVGQTRHLDLASVIGSHRVLDDFLHDLSRENGPRPRVVIKSMDRFVDMHPRIKNLSFYWPTSSTPRRSWTYHWTVSSPRLGRNGGISGVCQC